VSLPLPKSKLGGKLGAELDKLAAAINSLRPISSPGVFTSQTTAGVSRLSSRGRRPALVAVEFRYLRVDREGWLALECYDSDSDETLLVWKPDALARLNGFDSSTSYSFAGHTITAQAETDTGTWPVEEGHFLKVRNLDAVGTDQEYHHQVTWPPYIAEADSLSNGSRVNSGGTPYSYIIATNQQLSMVGATIDDATLDAYDAGSPVGTETIPTWTDINADGRAWRSWSAVGNVLTDSSGLVVGE